METLKNVIGGGLFLSYALAWVVVACAVLLWAWRTIAG
jgi:hypothetical protein